MSQMPPDPYAALGVDRSAGFSEIRSAHRKLILKCHPDKFQDPALKAAKQDEFQLVQQAYEILSDESKREKYDNAVKLRKLREDAYKNMPPASAARSPPAPPASHPTYPGNPQFSRSWDEDERELGESRPLAAAERLLRRERADLRRREKKREREREERRMEDENRHRRESEPKKENIKKEQKYIPVYAEDDDADHEHNDWFFPRIPDHKSASKPTEPANPGSKIELEIEARNKRAYATLQSNASAASVNVPGDDATKPVEKKDAGETKPRTRLYSVPVSQLGLKIMAAGMDVSVDIVAVHGLGAIPEITWRDSTSGVGVTWLSDERMLPKEVPEARIMRFGYDSLWLGKEPIRTRLDTIARKLLLSLNRERGEDPERPLIFIGHCFGGLVIERALIIAKLVDTGYPGIFKSSSNLLAAIAAQSDLHQGIEPRVLDELRSENGTILDVSADFALVCRDRDGAATIMITCFFEQRASNLGKLVGRGDIQEFMVDEKSASIDGCLSYGLPLDHFRLNKFSDPDDGNYQDVCGEIVRFYNAAREIKKRNSNPVSAPIPVGTEQLPFATRTQQRGQTRTTPTKKEREREEESRKAALEELKREEEEKEKAFHNEKMAEGMEQQKAEAARVKKEAEHRYLDRLKVNMQKYGIEDPGSIINADPLPSDSELTEQEIQDKERWFKNRINTALQGYGLSETGILDEIINDTGDMMMIDGVMTTYTRMGAKWVSTATLKRYEVPYMIDPNDPSTIIVKRWVPQYEQEFFWEHSQKLRENRGRRKERDTDRKESLPLPIQPAAEYRRSAKQTRPAANPRQSPTPVRSPATPTRPGGRPRNRSYDSIRSAPDVNETEKQRQHSRRLSSDWSGPPRSSSQARRKGSSDSIRSAPGVEEIEKRRRNSRTLSGERSDPSRSSQARRKGSSDSVRYNAHGYEEEPYAEVSRFVRSASGDGTSQDKDRRTKWDFFDRVKSHYQVN